MSGDEEYPTVYQPPASLQKTAHVKSLDEYKALYRQSLDEPEVRIGGSGMTHIGFILVRSISARRAGRGLI